MLEKRDNTSENNKLARTNSDRQLTLFLRTLRPEKPVSSDTSHHVDLEHNIGDDTIIEHFRSTEQKKSEEKLSTDVIKHAIDEIRKENYGVIDLNNDQHVELLYCYISQRAKQRLKRPFEKASSDDQAQKRSRDELEEGTEEEPAKRVRLHKDLSSPSQEQGTEDENEKWQKEKLASPDVQNTSKTAFLGAGASIAYYLESLGKNFDHTESILIGTPQPWAGERGPGIIVQPEHMITPKRQFSERNEMNDIWPNREHFSQLVEDVLQEAGIKRETGQVTKIEKVDRFYRITYIKNGNEQSIYVKKVIFGLGSGKHSSRGIDETKVAKTCEEALSKEKRIMNMDIFSNVSDGLEKGDRRQETVIIVAGGVGIVGSMPIILNKGYKVEWIVSKQGAIFSPGQAGYAAYLPYLKHLSSIENDPEQKKQYDLKIRELSSSSLLEDLFQDQDKGIFTGIVETAKNRKFENVHAEWVEDAEQTDDGVIVRLQSGKELKGHYLVYGMGQDLSTFELLDENIRNDLMPDVDVNQRFNQLEDEKESTTLGLKTKDDSLKIIGAAAARIAPRIKAERTMKYVIESFPHNILANDVLTPIRSQVEATNNFMPYDINKKTNFITDDRTMLAVHLSARYPAIADYQSPVSATGKETASLVGILAEMIVRSRRQKGMKMETDSLSLDGPEVLPIPPNGHKFQETWDKALSRLEEYLQQNKQEG